MRARPPVAATRISNFGIAANGSARVAQRRSPPGGHARDVSAANRRSAGLDYLLELAFEIRGPARG